MEKHNQTVTNEFKKQAKNFSNKNLTLNKEEYIQWIIKSLQLREDMKVLDVAAGTGILSRAIAPFVDKVVSVDLTEDMIKEGMLQNKLKNINNIEYHQGNVENLPFNENSFDLVISRFAFHHFVDPARVLQEMKRVCKSSSTVSVVDMVSNENDLIYLKYNHYERLRDPSHTFALKKSQLKDLFGKSGININVEETVTVNVITEDWLNLTKTEEVVAEQIKKDLYEEISTKKVMTGMQPYVHDGVLKFKQTWMKIVGNTI
jgi:ubiquinone/menaquinone biosynthesis C-methylase UbiE